MWEGPFTQLLKRTGAPRSHRASNEPRIQSTVTTDAQYRELRGWGGGKERNRSLRNKEHKNTKKHKAQWAQLSAVTPPVGGPPHPPKWEMRQRPASGGNPQKGSMTPKESAYWGVSVEAQRASPCGDPQVSIKVASTPEPRGD